jgi:DNA-binding GntR family transcriptional regulator
VSALPVREAIRRLEAEGLVVFRPNVGAQVAPAEPGVFDEEMTVLAVLEGYATAQAAPLLTPEDLGRLTEITDRMVAAMESLDTLRFGRLNHEFHGVILARCPNTALVELVDGVTRRLDAIRRTVFVQIPYRGAASVADHRELIRLLSQPAPAAEIETAAREHKLSTVESFRAWRRDQEEDGMPLGGTAARIES